MAADFVERKAKRDNDLKVIRSRLSEIELLLLDIRHNAHIAATRPMSGERKSITKGEAAASKGGKK